MPLNPVPLPLDTPLVNKDGTIEFTLWVPYFVDQGQQVSQSAQRVLDEQVSPVNALSAAIAATPLNVGTTGGAFRINVITRITQAASVSSSLTPTIRWTEGGVALATAYAALTGNTTATYLPNNVLTMRIDSTTSLTYETAYASVGATPMKYGLEIIVERLA